MLLKFNMYLLQLQGIVIQTPWALLKPKNMESINNNWVKQENMKFKLVKVILNKVSLRRHLSENE